MSVLKYFKNTPGRPPKGRQALSVIFFFKFATRSLEKKGACRPLSSFEPENFTKNQEKKRGVRRRKAAKPCRIQHL